METERAMDAAVYAVEKMSRLHGIIDELLAMLKETVDELDAIIDQKGHTAQTRAIRDRAYALIAKAEQ